LTSCNNHEEQLQQLRLEVENAHRVTHKYVCRTFDLGLHRHDSGTQTPFITMELILGRSLSERVRAEGALERGEACRIGLAILEGLEAAHDAGVLHRDLKSDNVMLRDDRPLEPCPVLMDFGLSKSLTANSTSANDGQTLAGTLAYMAPEQLQGKKPRVATDLYAFGTVMFEMLTGRLPFIASTPALQALRRLQEPAPNIRDFTSGVSTELALFVARCLDQDPSGRPRSAREARSVLMQVPELRRSPSETVRGPDAVSHRSSEGSTAAAVSPTIRIPAQVNEGVFSPRGFELSVEGVSSARDAGDSSFVDTVLPAPAARSRSDGDDTTGPPTIFDAGREPRGRFARDVTAPGGITSASPRRPAVQSPLRKGVVLAVLLGLVGVAALTDPFSSHPSRAQAPEQTKYAAGTFPGTSTPVPTVPPSQPQISAAEGSSLETASEGMRSESAASAGATSSVILPRRAPVPPPVSAAAAPPRALATGEFPPMHDFAPGTKSPAHASAVPSVAPPRTCPRGILCPKGAVSTPRRP
jgi:serine/threonine protein kinase